MADFYTPQQRAAMDAVLAGTFDRLDTAPRIQPGFTMDQIYGGILPESPTSVANNAPYKSSYPTPAQLAAIKAVPAGSYQAPRAVPLDIDNQPYGYSFPDTGDFGRATPAMRQQLAIGLPTTAPLPQKPVGPPWSTPTSIDLAAMEKYGQPKPTGPLTPAWTTIGPLLAQAAFRQNAFQKANPLPAPAPTPVKTPWGMLSQQLFQQLLASQQPAGRKPVEITVRGGKSTPAQNYSLANALSAATAGGATGVGTNGYTYVNGVNVGYSPEVQAQRAAQGLAIGDANRASPTPTYTVSGDNNAFMPTSVQNSTRWQTGY